MKVFSHRLRPEELTTGIEGRLVLKNDVLLCNVSELREADENSVCFYENEKFFNDLKGIKVGLIIVPLDFDAAILPESNLFLCSKPYLTLNTIVTKWLEIELGKNQIDIHPTALLDEDVLLKEKVGIGGYSVIKKGVRIGSETTIGANVVIGENVRIGNNCQIYPNVTIYADTEIRDRVIIHANSVIGMDGFGYVYANGKHNKINHIGKVVIDNDVEIGANSCIDRSTFGVTYIGEGTKIDNLVQIGHNCRLGKNVILCSQVGLAGNTEIGDNVYLAGQVGAAGHLKIGDGAMVGAQSGISSSIPAGAKFFGTPAIDASLQKRIVVAIKKLPEILTFFNKIKKREQEEDK
ncbi:MAG: UDP-3-O-(3-hydroxymyristoyl)glucosamine N-acyltransferase [Candidatus Cloacimonetes bacterium]|nr:UDP-3-O-(3-hydroxymyristoyl)glucosamine N-acyltransferase [Candidatus Cloacimonadota bacterium]